MVRYRIATVAGEACRNNGNRAIATRAGASRRPRERQRRRILSGWGDALARECRACRRLKRDTRSAEFLKRLF